MITQHQLDLITTPSQDGKVLRLIAAIWSDFEMCKDGYMNEAHSFHLRNTCRSNIKVLIQRADQHAKQFPKVKIIAERMGAWLQYHAEIKPKSQSQISGIGYVSHPAYFESGI